jgi:pSer/pThr/pTyr-binding forkhead associated (FHA) protein
MTRDRVANPLDDTTRMAPSPEAPIVTEGQSAAAYLVVLSGSSVGEMYRLDKERVVLGRGDKADLRLIDDGISREHARIVRDGGQMFLEDLGSTNGTYRNGERVKREALAEGDKIRRQARRPQPGLRRRGTNRRQVKVAATLSARRSRAR